jgi:hypothetical protein
MGSALAGGIQGVVRRGLSLRDAKGEAAVNQSMNVNHGTPGPGSFKCVDALRTTKRRRKTLTSDVSLTLQS